MTLRSLMLGGTGPLLAPPDSASGAAPPSGSGSPSPTSPTDSGAGAAPSPTPVSPSTVEGEVRETDGLSGSFDALSSFDDLDELPLPPTDGGGEGEEPGAVPPPDKVAPAPGAPPPPPAPPSPAAPPPPAPTQPGAPDLTTPEGVLRGLENAEAARHMRSFLAQNVYSLSDEEKKALDTDAVGAIPNIMARVHLEGTKNVLTLLTTLVPEMIQRGVAKALEGREKGQSALTAFFQAWPGLNEQEHSALVDQYATAFRNMNPKASRSEAIKFVGAAIHAQLGIPIGSQPPPRANGNGHAPQARIVSRRPVPAFAPARPGAREPVSPTAGQSPFDGLGQEFDDEM